MYLSDLSSAACHFFFHFYVSSDIKNSMQNATRSSPTILTKEENTSKQSLWMIILYKYTSEDGPREVKGGFPKYEIAICFFNTDDCW